MRYVIFSDLHDNGKAFRQVMREAEQHAADRLIYLGDVGRSPALFALLRQHDIPCTFGNWETNGWQRLPAELAAWTGAWPATICEGDAIFCHATPDMPAAAQSTQAAAAHMRGGVSWLTLFPRLHRDENAVWDALAVLEAQELRVAFHGHTHVQLVWSWLPAQDAGTECDVRQLRSFAPSAPLALATGTTAAPARYIIGVGSAGDPQDGPQGAYALYDAAAQTVHFCHL